MKTRLKTAREFFEFYHAQPDHNFISLELTKGCKHCALGFLGVRDNEDTTEYIYPTKIVKSNVLSLGRLFIGRKKVKVSESISIIYRTNDGTVKGSYLFSENRHKNNILNKLLFSMEFNEACEVAKKYALDYQHN